MAKLYYPTPDEVHGCRPLSEDAWFRQYQDPLIRLANTHEGRDLLCLDSWQQRPYPIIALKKHWACYYMGQTEAAKFTKISDFRVGSKWGNVIRYRWKAVKAALERMEFLELLRLPTLILVDGRRVPVVAGGDNTTYYPDPDSESSPTTVDGFTRATQPTSWGTLHGHAGTAATDNGVSYSVVVQQSTGGSTFLNIYRGIHLYNTSDIGTDTKTEGSWQFTSGLALSQFAEAASLSLSTSDPATATELVAGDHDSLGSVDQATDKTFSSITANSTDYNSMGLNVDGLASVTVDGITKFGSRVTYDMDDSPPTLAGGDVQANCDILTAEQTGTSKDQKLVILHSPPPLTGDLALPAVWQFGETQPNQMYVGVRAY